MVKKYFHKENILLNKLLQWNDLSQKSTVVKLGGHKLVQHVCSIGNSRLIRPKHPPHVAPTYDPNSLNSMVINTRRLWGVTKKVQLITMRTLITMTFQMVLISWVYIWPQNRPKRSLSNLSWNFWVFPVTSSGRNGKQRGGECFCFGNFLALFVLPSLLCAHSHQERENW